MGLEYSFIDVRELCLGMESNLGRPYTNKKGEKCYLQKLEHVNDDDEIFFETQDERKQLLRCGDIEQNPGPSDDLAQAS